MKLSFITGDQEQLFKQGTKQYEEPKWQETCTKALQTKGIVPVQRGMH